MSAIRKLQTLQPDDFGGSDGTERRDIMLPPSLQQALKACRTLPSVPVVVLEVLELCQDEEICISKVAKVITRDPALSAKVLKVANSPWYGVRAQIKTLDRAVTLLGINATLSLALSFSLVRGLRRSKGARFDHQAYWRRSVIAATASQVVGSFVRAASRDELFLGGLLQDIGMLVLNEAMPRIYGPLVASANGDHAMQVELERKELGADHAQVGTWLLARWNLPDNLQAAVAGSHDSAGDRRYELFAKAVAAGSRIAEIWTNPNTAGASVSAQIAANSILDIPRDRFEMLLSEVAFELPDVVENLNIDIGGEAFINRLLDQARDALVELNLQAQQQARMMRIQAQRDELTSLSNRAYLNEFLPQEFDVCRQAGQSLTVIFLDIDNFKNINDTQGHQGGDMVLKSVARVLQSSTRNFDTVVRYGGDEFVVLLPNTSEQIALMVSERICAAVAAQPHKVGENKEIPVTISVGCASTTPENQFNSATELLDAADRCLYAAKSGGRNRVVTYKAPSQQQT
jgi:diguanylate cyclase (GGDEF)-like protein